MGKLYGIVSLCFFATIISSTEGNNVGHRDLMLLNLRNRTYYEGKFFEWMKNFKKSFHSPFEFVHRLNVFARNDDYIKKVNENSHIHNLTLGHNEFSHLTNEEFKEHYLGLKISQDYLEKRRRKSQNMLKNEKTEVPREINWVKEGAVTPVKNQGRCGSCWAFSTTGAIEGSAFKSSGSLTSYSEQELVDCDHNGDMGCGGGLMDHAFKWIEMQGGLCKEDDYSYDAKVGVCKTCKAAVKVISYVDVEPDDEEALKQAVAKQPVSVAIEADQPEFQFYKSGVFSKGCGTKLDHGVLIVGYGEEDGQEYWLVKNSWGSSWGLDGYIKIARNTDQPEGHCGIAMVPSYPEAEVINDESNNDKVNAKITQESIPKLVKLNSESSFESSAKISQCGDKQTSFVKFTSLSISPAEPKRGEPIHFDGHGVVKQPFYAATFDLSVSLGDTVVFSHTGNMCGESHVELPLHLGHINIKGFQCPVHAGPFKAVDVDVKLPKIAPSGNYKIRLTSSFNSDSLFCVNVNLGLTKDGMVKESKVYELLE